MTRRLCFAIALLMTGCFSSNVSPSVVKVKAASDLDCSEDQLQVENPTGSNWKAKGCGKTATYMCSGSNFMSEGSCLRDN
jgi:hypothetical protein